MGMVIATREWEGWESNTHSYSPLDEDHVSFIPRFRMLLFCDITGLRKVWTSWYLARVMKHLIC